MFADNVDFTGSSVSSGTATMLSNGQLLIGSSVSPRIRVGSLGSSDGSITWTVGNGTITGQVTGGSVTGKTITGNSGGALSPTSGNWNIVGTGSITNSGSGSTLTTQLTGITNHAIQIGAGTATLTQLGAGTTGQILQTNTTADPTWSTATYPSTTTANQILYSSATNTVSQITTAANGVLITNNSSVPSLLANGTAGQILTANSGAPPSWQNNNSFRPNAVINLSDDFIGSLTSASLFLSQLAWFNQSAQAGTVTSDHPGVLTCTNISSTGTSLVLLARNVTVGGCIIVGGGAITINWVFNIATLSDVTNRYVLMCGFGDATTGVTDLVNGIYLRYSDNVNSGNWTYGTAAASSRTTTNSSTAVTTGWHNAQVVINAAGTSCTFFMDGVSLGAAVVGTIPSVAVGPSFLTSFVSGTILLGSVAVDLMYLSQTLTNVR